LYKERISLQVSLKPGQSGTMTLSNSALRTKSF